MSDRIKKLYDDKKYAFLSNDVRLAMGVLYDKDGDVNIGIDADCSVTNVLPEYLFTNDGLQIKADEIGFLDVKISCQQLVSRQAIYDNNSNNADINKRQ